MDNWMQLVIAIVSSSVLSTLVTALLNRKKNKQEMEFNYIEKLESRIQKLEVRQDRFEIRDSIFSSATACANACDNPADQCPVLKYLQTHPLPDKTI